MKPEVCPLPDAGPGCCNAARLVIATVRRRGECQISIVDRSGKLSESIAQCASFTCACTRTNRPAGHPSPMLHAVQRRVKPIRGGRVARNGPATELDGRARGRSTRTLGRRTQGQHRCQQRRNGICHETRRRSGGGLLTDLGTTPTPQHPNPGRELGAAPELSYGIHISSIS